MKKLKSSNGFTLVELIVVIAMLAILSSVSIGGFEYSQKRAAIQNDKALVKQLNQVLDSYSIFTHNEGAIHDALIEELGDTIEIQSLKFGYDIYYIEDMYEFELRVQKVNSENHKNLQHYLDYEGDFTINTEYYQENCDGTYSKIIADSNNTEYELEVGVYIEYGESNQPITIRSHEVLLNNIVIKTSDAIELDFSRTIISEVIYDNTTYIQPEITNDNRITFSHPGNYEITITDGTIDQIIKVSVYNICSLYSKSPVLENADTSLFVVSNVYHSQDGSYEFHLPILSYIEVIDYYYNEQNIFVYNDVNISIHNNVCCNSRLNP